MTANSIRTIAPYRNEYGVWAFDDAVTGLIREPFVGEVNDMLDRLTAHIAGARQGVLCLFSSEPFPGWQACLEWTGEDLSGVGNNYRLGQVEGWLCPALLRYFESAPMRIYVAFRSREQEKPKPQRKIKHEKIKANSP